MHLPTLPKEVLNDVDILEQFGDGGRGETARAIVLRGRSSALARTRDRLDVTP